MDDGWRCCRTFDGEGTVYVNMNYATAVLDIQGGCRIRFTDGSEVEVNHPAEHIVKNVS